MHFECFMAVVELGTTSRAADALHISQPQVSQRISQLEKTLDVSLFIRQNHRLVLTEAGKLFSARCGQFLENISSVVQELAPYYNSSKTKALRVGFSEGQDPGATLCWLQELKEIFPEIKIMPEVVPWVETEEALLSGKLDLCIIFDLDGLCDNVNLQSRIISHQPLQCVVRGDSVLAKKETIDFSDLEGATSYYSAYQRNTKIQNEHEEFFLKQGVHIHWVSKNLDFFTLRRYLDTGKSCFLTYSTIMEDTVLKTYILGGITKPLAVIWKKRKKNNIEVYAEELASIIKKTSQKIG